MQRYPVFMDCYASNTGQRHLQIQYLSQLLPKSLSQPNGLVWQEWKSKCENTYGTTTDSKQPQHC